MAKLHSRDIRVIGCKTYDNLFQNYASDLDIFDLDWHLIQTEVNGVKTTQWLPLFRARWKRTV